MNLHQEHPLYDLAMKIEDYKKSEPVEKDSRIDRMIHAAKYAMMLQIPYVFGGTYEKSKSFDCSAFVQSLYKYVGSSIPRTTRQQILKGRKVDFEDIRPGDLIFYDTSGRKSQVNHVALYMGDREMIHTNSPSDGINIQNIDSGRHAKWMIEVRRILPEEALEGYGK